MLHILHSFNRQSELSNFFVYFIKHINREHKILVFAVYTRSLAYNFLNVFLQIIIQMCNYDV